MKHQDDYLSYFVPQYGHTLDSIEISLAQLGQGAVTAGLTLPSWMPRYIAL